MFVMMCQSEQIEKDWLKFIQRFIDNRTTMMICRMRVRFSSSAFYSFLSQFIIYFVCIVSLRHFISPFSPSIDGVTEHDMKKKKL